MLLRYCPYDGTKFEFKGEGHEIVCSKCKCKFRGVTRKFFGVALVGPKSTEVKSDASQQQASSIKGSEDKNIEGIPAVRDIVNIDHPRPEGAGGQVT